MTAALAPHLRRARRTAQRVVPLREPPRSEPIARRKKILIGGIPRAGTTMTVRLIGQDPAIFLWPGESSVLALTRSLWEGGQPAASCRNQIQTYVHDTLSKAMIEMHAWNVSNEKRLRSEPAATPEEVRVLADEIVASAMEASSVRTSLRAACAAMDRFVAGHTNQDVLVEKTPSNLFAYSHLADDPAIHWVLCHREPFATIASLQARAGKDPYATDWSPNIEFGIGAYLRHAEHVLRASRSTSPPVIAPYESTSADPQAFMMRLTARLGAERTIGSVGEVRRANDRDAWRKLAPLDRWKVLRLTEPVRRLLGYDENYYGVDEATMLEGFEAPDSFEWTPLYGVYAPDGGTSGRWVSDEAAFSIYAPHGVRSVRARLFNPSSMNLPEQKVIVRDGARRCIGEVALPTDQMSAIDIDLGSITPAATTSKGRLFRIELQPTHRRLPVASLVGNNDRRLMSFFMAHWTPHA